MPHLAGLAGLTHGNGLELLLNVDADGNLTGMRTSDGSTVVQDLTLAYDAASAITAITDNLDSSRSQSFDYDGVGRLVWADGAYGEIDYGYDLVGNRTRRTVDGGATADDFYAYEAGSHRLASVTSGPSVRAFDYTAAGSTSLDTRGGVEVEFGYGASGRLTQVTSDTGALASRTYGYDAAGKRVRETRVNRLPDGGGVISTSHGYVYDLDGRLLAEYSTLGLSPTVRREYVWLGDTPVAMVDHAAPGDPLLAIHTDHLGRPQKLTDASQAVVWDGQFDPFGEEHAVTGTTDQPLRFPGQEWDAATGLSQNWNRDYDPTLGRYIESDPIGLEGGVSTYGYVGGDPINSADPNGLLTIFGGVGISSVFGFGGDANLGLYYHWESGRWGLFSSAGVGPGRNIGADAFLGAVCGGPENLEGEAVNVSLSDGRFTGGGIFGADGRPLGLFVGGGPGKPGVSVTRTIGDVSPIGRVGCAACRSRFSARRTESYKGWITARHAVR